MKRSGSMFAVVFVVTLSVSFVSARIGSDPSHLEVVTLSFETPLSIGVNEALNRAYIGNETGFHVVDGETNQIIDYIPLDFEVKMIVVNPLNDDLFVSGSGTSVTHVLDGTTYEAVGTLPVRLWGPYAIAINPVTNLVYMADRSVTVGVPDYVRVYNGSDLSHVTSIEIPGSRQHPYIESVGVAVNPETNLLYATWTGDESLHLINCTTHEIVKKVTPSSHSTRVLVNPTTALVYVGYVVLNGTSLEEVMELVVEWVKSTPDAVNPRDNLVMWTHSYPTFPWSPFLYVVDGSSHETLASLQLEWDTNDVAVNAVTGKMYLLHRWDQRISVVQERPGSHNHVVINEVELNPPGEDTGDLEWVELYNPTPSPVDIGGLELRSRSGDRRTTIPSETTIDAGEYYVIDHSYVSEWLDNAKESIILVNASSWSVIDMFPSRADLEDDASTWQRYPDGTDAWVFEESTPGYPDIPEFAPINALALFIVSTGIFFVLVRGRALMRKRKTDPGPA